MNPNICISPTNGSMIVSSSRLESTASGPGTVVFEARRGTDTERHRSGMGAMGLSWHVSRLLNTAMFPITPSENRDARLRHCRRCREVVAKRANTVPNCPACGPFAALAHAIMPFRTAHLHLPCPVGRTAGAGSRSKRKRGYGGNPRQKE